MLAVLWTVFKIILLILLGIVVLAVLLLSLKYGVEISYSEDGTLRARIKVLFFGHTLYPRKKKPVKIRRFSRRAYEKRLAKQAKKEAEKEKHKKEHAPQKKKKKKRPSIMALIRFATYLLKRIPQRLLRCFHLDIAHLSVTVATDDPAKTAIRYGVIAQSLAYLLALADKALHLSRRSWKRTRVDADFLGTRMRISARVTLAIRPIRLFPFGIFALYHLLKARDLLYPAEDAKAEEAPQSTQVPGEASTPQKTA